MLLIVKMLNLEIRQGTKMILDFLSNISIYKKIPAYLKTYHFIHKSNKAPERINLISQQEQNGRQQITHALDVAQVKIVHHVGHKNVVQQL